MNKSHISFEMPIVPKFVDKFLKDYKANCGNGAPISTMFARIEERPESEVLKWIKGNSTIMEDGVNQKKLILAYYGEYEVEKDEYVVSFYHEDIKFYFTDFSSTAIFLPNGAMLGNEDDDIFRFDDEEKAKALAILIDGEVVKL